MAWKYMNPGDYRLLDIYSTGDLNIYDKKFAPRTGIACFITAYVNYCISLPSTKEIWFKFTIAFLKEGSYTCFHFSSNPVNGSYRQGLYIFSRASDYYIENYRNNSNSKTYYLNSLISNDNQIVILDLFGHLKSDTSNGECQYYVNKNLMYSFSGSVNNGSDISIMGICNRSSSGYYGPSYISDIIISTEELNMDEHCAFIPIKVTTSPDWNYHTEDNSFTTDNVDKTISQVLDIDKLKKTINLSNPNITGVQSKILKTVTNNSEIIDSLKCELKKNSTIIDSQTKPITNDTNLNFDLLPINPNTNEDWNINDLENLEVNITTAKS